MTLVLTMLTVVACVAAVGLWFIGAQLARIADALEDSNEP